MLKPDISILFSSLQTCVLFFLSHSIRMFFSRYFFLDISIIKFFSFSSEVQMVLLHLPLSLSNILIRFRSTCKMKIWSGTENSRTQSKNNHHTTYILKKNGFGYSKNKFSCNSHCITRIKVIIQ